jgi:hypothetical protein
VAGLFIIDNVIPTSFLKLPPSVNFGVGPLLSAVLYSPLTSNCSSNYSHMNDLLDTLSEPLLHDLHDFYLAAVNTDSDESDCETDVVTEPEGYSDSENSDNVVDHVAGAFSGLTLENEYEEHYNYLMTTNPSSWFSHPRYEHITVSTGEDSVDSEGGETSTDEEYRRFRTRPHSERRQRSVSQEATNHDDDYRLSSPEDEGNVLRAPIPDTNLASNYSIVSLSSIGMCLCNKYDDIYIVSLS